MKSILKISLWLLLIVGAGFLLGFVNKEQKNKKVWNFDVIVEASGDNQFINSEMIKDQIADLGIQVIGTNTIDIPLEKIQKSILQNPSVKSSTVYKTLDGQVIANVEQRKPIARIFNSDGTSFYLDSDGQVMPLSRHYTARVLIVNGKVNEKSGRSVKQIKANESLKESSIIDDVFALVNYINSDEVLKAQIDCVIINDDDEFELIPRLGNQRVVLGKIENLDMKFKKLKAFYKEIIQVEQLDQYSRINLKYKDQIVCDK